MLSRNLQRVFIASRSFKNRKAIKNSGSLIAPGLIFTKQQLILPSCMNFHLSARCHEEEKLHIPKDPQKRTEYIDEDAQKKIDAMMKENPKLENFKQVIEMEITLWKQQGNLIPEEIKPRHWLELLQTESKNRRRRHLEFLFKIEKKEENRKQKQKEKELQLEQSRLLRDKPGVKTDVMEYSIGKNSMFRRINEKSMNVLYNWNSLKAIMYGNKIVFDCSYEKYMNKQESKSCAKQIMAAFSMNRQHNFPFHVYLCNVDLSGQLVRDISNFIPSLFDDDFPWTVTPKSFVEIFDKSKIVYLSGHTNQVMEKYDCDSVYIVGAFVDKSCQAAVSLAKAKELGLKTAKFPIDSHLHFGDGSNKNLTLNQVMGIMLDVQRGDWTEAFQHVPKRKLFESRVKSLEKRLQRSQFYNEGNNQNADDKTFSSSPVSDYSYAARVKMRSSWNKN